MSNPSVAILGTGTMGAGVARTLLRNGFRVSVWNRSRGRAEPLAADGALVASSPAAAVRAADVVLTVVFDGPAVLDVLQQARGGWGADALLMQCATVGVAAASKIAAEAEQSGVAMIETMMLGTKGPAQTGKIAHAGLGRSAPG